MASPETTACFFVRSSDVCSAESGYSTVLRQCEIIVTQVTSTQAAHVTAAPGPATCAVDVLNNTGQ